MRFVKVNFFSRSSGIFCVNSRLIRKLQNQIRMRENWIMYTVIAVVTCLLLSVFDKFKIIKSKPLRYFVVIFVGSIICRIISDLIA